MKQKILKETKNGINILVVEDDKFAMENILLSLEPEGYIVDTAVSAYQAEKLIEKSVYDILITDVKLPGIDGITFAEKCKTKFPNIKVIVITGFADEPSVIRALKIGVNEFLKKPYREKEMLISVQKLVHLKQLEEENRSLQEHLSKENYYLKKEIKIQEKVSSRHNVIGESEGIKKCLLQSDKVAQFKINAMIRGESGTGKEVIAQYIHANSHRADKPFITVNCASISPSLFEAEMFGYEKGAFTGATEAHAGLFEIANKGLIFLDELTEIPSSMQAKLLRVLEQQNIRRVGSTKQIDIDVQVIAATNRNINEAIEKGFLRMDLYHRIALLEINIPPLRERIEDLELLYAYFVEMYNDQFQVKAPKMTEKFMTFLKSQKWEGNIRQFSNFVKKWCLFGLEASEADVRLWVNSTNETRLNDHFESVLKFDFISGNVSEIEQAKQMLVQKILSLYKGNKSKAANHLGLSYPGLLKIMNRIEIKQLEN
jgi:DNA-binding NtrC family response regulator